MGSEMCIRDRPMVRGFFPAHHRRGVVARGGVRRGRGSDDDRLAAASLPSLEAARAAGRKVGGRCGRDERTTQGPADGANRRCWRRGEGPVRLRPRGPVRGPSRGSRETRSGRRQRHHRRSYLPRPRPGTAQHARTREAARSCDDAPIGRTKMVRPSDPRRSVFRRAVGAGAYRSHRDAAARWQGVGAPHVGGRRCPRRVRRHAPAALGGVGRPREARQVGDRAPRGRIRPRRRRIEQR